MLLITLFLMGFPTIIIGLIPSYDSIGYWAAFLLVLMRLLQGIAVGGEWGGAILLAVEHAPEGKKGFFGSLPQTGVATGLILSSLAMGLVAQLPEEDMLQWGWRIPFLASSVLLAVGWFIRERVGESPDFVAIEKKPHAEAPAKTVFYKHWRQLLSVAGARLAEVTWFYTVATFSLTYATKTLQLPKQTILGAIVWGAAVAIFTMPFCGWLGDKWGQKKVFALGVLALMVFTPVFFHLLQSRDSFWIVTSMVIAIGVVYALLYGPEGALFSAQFEPEVRYTGISIGVQVSGAIGGGLAPMIATALLSFGSGEPFYISCYLMGLGVIALVAVACMRKTPSIADPAIPQQKLQPAP
jgi:MFS family permease